MHDCWERPVKIERKVQKKIVNYVSGEASECRKIYHLFLHRMGLPFTFPQPKQRISIKAIMFLKCYLAKNSF